MKHKLIHLSPSRLLLGLFLIVLLGLSAAGIADPQQVIPIIKQKVSLVVTKSTTVRVGEKTEQQGNGALDFEVTVNGQTYSNKSITATFEHLTTNADGSYASGKIKLTGGRLDDYLGTGMAIDVKDGMADFLDNGGDHTCRISIYDGIMQTPYADASGAPFPLTFRQDITIYIQESGKTSLTAPEGEPVTGKNNAPNSFTSGGITVRPKTLSLSLTSTATTAPSLTASSKEGILYTSLPQLLMQDASDLPLYYKNLTVDDNGAITAANMVMAEIGPVDVPLANPAGYTLLVYAAGISLVNSRSTACKLTARLILPDCVHADNAGNPAYTPFFVLDLMKDPIVDLDNSPESIAANTAMRFFPPLDFAVCFSGYQVIMKNIIIDLSRTGPNNSSALTPGINGKMWQGIYARNALVTMPMDKWKTGNGDPVQIPTQNCYVDANGFTGEVNVTTDADHNPDIKISGFQPHWDRFYFAFGRGHIMATDCRGSTTIPNFDTGKNVLNLVVNLGNGEANARIAQPCAIVDSHLGLTLSVATGQVKEATDGSGAIWLNGGMQLDLKNAQSLKDSLLPFHNLGVDSSGLFLTAQQDHWLALDVPADINFDVFHAHVSSVAFNRPNNANWVLDLQAELSLNADIPVSGAVDYGLLQVAASGDGAAINYQDIKVDANVVGLVHITSTLNRHDDPHDKKLSCLTGDAKMQLTFLGDPIDLSDMNLPNSLPFKLYIGEKNMWAVAGKLELPTAIVLGSSGLALDSFIGGLARNMSAPNGFSEPSQLLPAPGSNSWLFMAGCGIEAADAKPLFHAIGTLTIGYPSFDFDIYAKGWFLTAADDPPDGMAQVNVNLNPSIPSFSVSAAVDMGIPPGLNLETVHGTLGALFSPAGCSVDIGWPYPDNAVSIESFGGGYSARGGAHITPDGFAVAFGGGFNYLVLKGSIDCGFDVTGITKLDPAIHGHINASGEVDFYVISIGASASLDAWLNKDNVSFDGEFTASVGMPWPIPDLDVSVGFSGSYPN